MTFIKRLCLTSVAAAMCMSAAQAQQECVDSYLVLGSTDADGDGVGDGGCYTDGSGYYDISWTGGCLAVNLNYSGGDIDITANGFTEGFIFFGFEAGIEEDIIITFEDGGIGNYGPVANDCTPAECGNGVCEAGEDATSCPDDCEAGECPAGQVADCDGSGECWTELWIGDGYCDGTAQQYGADLCCYDTDGGDCTAEECVEQVCGDGVCGPGENPTTCPDDCDAAECVTSYLVEGSTDYDGDEVADLCYTDGTGYYNISWTGGCLAVNLNYSGGDIDISGNGFTAGFIFFGFDPGIEEDIIITFEDGGIGNYGPVANDCPNTAECGNGVCEAGESFETCPDDCVDGCQAGEIEDCDGTGECWPTPGLATVTATALPSSTTLTSAATTLTVVTVLPKSVKAAAQSVVTESAMQAKMPPAAQLIAKPPTSVLRTSMVTAKSVVQTLPSSLQPTVAPAPAATPT